MSAPCDPMFGAAPVLNDESVEVYEECYRHVLEFFQPTDEIEARLARDYAYHDWDICRWRRKKIAFLSGIDERYIDTQLVMLIRGERINRLLENAEQGRERAYHDFIMHRKLLRRAPPGQVESISLFPSNQPVRKLADNAAE
jgi:hypothetical protein